MELFGGGDGEFLGFEDFCEARGGLAGAVEVFSGGDFCVEFLVGEGVVDGSLDAGGAGGPGEVEDVGVAFAVFLAVAEVDDGECEGGGFDDAGGGVADEEGGVLEELPEVGLGEVHGDGGFGFFVGAEDSGVAGVVVGADGDEGEVGFFEGVEGLECPLLFKGVVGGGGVEEEEGVGGGTMNDER